MVVAADFLARSAVGLGAAAPNAVSGCGNPPEGAIPVGPGGESSAALFPKSDGSDGLDGYTGGSGSPNTACPNLVARALLRPVGTGTLEGDLPLAVRGFVGYLRLGGGRDSDP